MTTTEQQPRTQETPVGNFYILRQDGALRIKPDADGLSQHAWDKATPSNREKVRARWSDIKQMLGIEDSEPLNRNTISRLINDREAKENASKNVYEWFGNMYGIEGGPEMIASKFREYARQANETISGITQHDKIAIYPIRFEIANEVQAKDNPVDLMLLALDTRYDARVRFEAKRKLELMDLAAKIDHRENKINTRASYGLFTDFLDENVWLPTMKRGAAEFDYLLSSHDPNTDACTEAIVLDEKQKEDAIIQEGQRLTLLPRRKFESNGKEIPIYFTSREKPRESQILKLLRKGAENPALAVDDEIGLMGVLECVEDVKAFKKKLRKSATDAGSMLTFEEIEDTLTGGEHIPSSIGSSSEVHMFKCFVRVNGARIEMILHTNKTYLDYKYKSGVAHEEYETKRLYDSGVMELLFPPNIYNYDLEQMESSTLENVRRMITTK